MKKIKLSKKQIAEVKECIKHWNDIRDRFIKGEFILRSKYGYILYWNTINSVNNNTGYVERVNCYVEDCLLCKYYYNEKTGCPKCPYVLRHKVPCYKHKWLLFITEPTLEKCNGMIEVLEDILK